MMGGEEEVVVVIGGVVGGGGLDVLLGVYVVPLVKDVASEAVDADERKTLLL